MKQIEIMYKHSQYIYLYNKRHPVKFLTNGWSFRRFVDQNI